MKNTFHSDGVRRLTRENLNAWTPGQTTSLRASQYLYTRQHPRRLRAGRLGRGLPANDYASTKYNAQMWGARGSYTTPGKHLPRALVGGAHAW